MHSPKAKLVTGLLYAACLMIGAGAKSKYFPQSDASQAGQIENVYAMAEAGKSAPVPPKSAPTKRFIGLTVYSDDKAPDNHYAPTGWMGDHEGLKMDADWSDKPRSGNTCIRFSYKPSGGTNAKWVSVFWQDPPNNWGEVDGGYDLTGASRLTFWARGERGGEVLKEVRVGGIKGNYFDSDSVVSGPLTMDTAWKQYSINLKGVDLSAISGGFYWLADSASNPEGLTFYLDDIRFE